MEGGFSTEIESPSPPPPDTRRQRFLAEATALGDFVLSTWAYLLLYLVVGGAAVCWLEAGADAGRRETRLQHLRRLNLTEAQWEGLSAAGIYQRPAAEEAATVWTLPNAVFLLLTSVTTIGYGTHTPRTAAGMVFTCAYSLVGIGFVATITLRTAEGCIRCLRVLAEDPQRKARLAAEAWAALDFRTVDADQRGALDQEQLRGVLQALGHGRPPSADVVAAVLAAAADDAGRVPAEAFPLAVATFYTETRGQVDGGQGTVLGLAVALFLSIWLGGALCFVLLEGWSLVEALWFGYATLTTMGFGDYAPATAAGQAFAFLYIVGGLGMAALVVSASS